MSKPDRIGVEVAYAESDHQFLRALEVQVGATIADAILASGIVSELSLDMNALSVGIWSRPADRLAVVEEGDRIEIYRPLKIDPKDARRQRARARTARSG